MTSTEASSSEEKAATLRALHGVALVPLLIPGVALGLLAAAIVLPVRVIRRLRARTTRPPRAGAAVAGWHRLQVCAR
jgi:hypothetical protein